MNESEPDGDLVLLAIASGCFLGIVEYTISNDYELYYAGLVILTNYPGHPEFSYEVRRIPT